MSDKRTHRGAHPKDAELFAGEMVPRLRSAVGDLSWLLGRGYALPSSQKIVGDRYALTARQRIAVARSACGDEALTRRQSARVAAESLAGGAVLVDGYNLLITIESALAGGVILVGRDGACRDLASMHGSYRTMAETLPALELIGRHFAKLGLADVQWLLDAPVSNSGRLKTRMLALAGDRGWPWSVELARDVDSALREAEPPVVSSDSAVLDACQRWANLALAIIEADVPDAWVIDFSKRM